MTAALRPDRPNRGDDVRVLEPGIVAAYLARLGVPAEDPSPAALRRLHRAHVERIPYETFWIHLRENVGIAPDESARRFATSTRGGYCYQLNGAFSALLASLGYAVTRHVAGVHDADGPSVATLHNHAALVVAGLATDANPSGRWYVDAGLGDALHEPLPLVPGRYRQGAMRVGIETVTGGGVGHWHFVNDPRGSLAGVSIVDEATGMDAFLARHAFNVTSPESSFRRTVTCQRRHATGIDVLRNRVLTRRAGPTVTTETIESTAHLQAVLAEVFGLHLDVAGDRLRSLWGEMCARHEAWLAEQAATA